MISFRDLIDILITNKDEKNCFGYENMVDTTSKLDKPKLIKNGIELFYKEQYEDAKLYFEEAYKEYKSGHAIRYLGRVEDRLGNHKKALEFYIKGIYLKDGKSIYYLGRSYHLGLGVAKDIKKALKLYKIAIECGRINGVIAKIHRVFVEERNTSGFINYLKWYEVYAKKHKVKEAWYNIGLYYENNNYNVLQDIDKSIDAFTRASKYGCCQARLKLATFYIKGQGVGKNINRAKHYMSLAKEQCPDKVRDLEIKFEKELFVY